MLFQLLLAQAEAVQNISVPPWMQAGGFGVLISLFAWWIWYTTSVGIPKMQQENRDAVKVLNDKHAATIENVVAQSTKAIEKLTNDFRDETREQRENCQREQERFWQMMTKRE